MNVLGLPDSLGKPLAIALIDLLLAGDNALVLALVCRSLPPRRLRVVLLLGTLGAVVLRVALVGLAGSALAVPGLKLVGGVLLTLLAINLVRPDARRSSPIPSLDGRSELLAATVLVMLIDVMMSLDNVVALAAVAGGSFFYLALGLTLSVAILMFGSGVVSQVLHRYPDLGRLGAALLGWIGGQMVLADPSIAPWIGEQAPALPLVVPLLVATYVYLLGAGTPSPAAEPAPTRKAAPRPEPPAVPVVPDPPRVDPPVARPVVPVPALVTAVEHERAAPRPVELALFIGLFAVSGLLLGLALLFGGGMLAH